MKLKGGGGVNSPKIFPPAAIANKGHEELKWIDPGYLWARGLWTG